MKNIHLILILLFSIKTIGQVEHTKNYQNNSKVLNIGERFEGKKDGLWIKYYNPERRYVSSVVDTLYKSIGRFKKGKKVGKWKYFGSPKILNRKLPYDFEPNLDSIVSYNQGRRIHSDIFDSNNFLKSTIKENDSLKTVTYYKHDRIKFGKDYLQQVTKPINLHQVIETYKNKKLKIELVYSQGYKFKKMFTNESERNKLLKVWFRGTELLSFERTSTKKDYDFIVYYEDGTLFKIEKHRNSKLYNAIYYGKNGELLDSGNFKNGNGILKTYEMTSNLLSQQLEYKNGEYIRNIKN